MTVVFLVWSGPYKIALRWYKRRRTWWYGWQTGDLLIGSPPLFEQTVNRMVQALRASGNTSPCVSKQCPADGVWRIGRGGSPDRVLKTRFTPSESSAGHGLPPLRAPKQCPANGVRRVLRGFVSRHGLLDTVKKHMDSREKNPPQKPPTPIKRVYPPFFWFYVNNSKQLL